MGLRGVRADAKYVVRAWFRLRYTVVVSLVIPLLLLVAFGVFLDPGAADAKPTVHVADLDQSAASASLLDRLGQRGSVVLSPITLNVDPDAWMRESGASALLVMPQGYGESGAEPVLLLRPDDSSSRVVAEAVEAALLAQDAGESPPRLLVRDADAPPPAPYRAFLLPGVMGLTVVTVGLTMSFGSVTQLRRQGLLERLAVSPMTKAEWILARMLGQTVITLLVTSVLVLAAVFILDTPVRVSIATLVLVVAGTLVFAGLGVLLAGVVKTPETGEVVINVVMLPLFLLSGSFFDVSSLPAFLRWLPQASPLKHLNDGLRLDMVAGDATGGLVYGAGLLAGAAGLVIVGARLIDWTDPE